MGSAPVFNAPTHLVVSVSLPCTDPSGCLPLGSNLFSFARQESQKDKVRLVECASDSQFARAHGSLDPASSPNECFLWGNGCARLLLLPLRVSPFLHACAEESLA